MRLKSDPLELGLSVGIPISFKVLPMVPLVKNAAQVKYKTK